MLVYHFLEKYTAINRKERCHIDPEAISAMTSRSWPGNVRELENVIERGIILCNSDRITLTDFFPRESVANTSPLFDQEIYALPFKEAKDSVMKAFHHRYIHRILQQNKGNISRAAEQAGLQRQYLHRLIKEGNIDAEIFKES